MGLAGRSRIALAVALVGLLVPGVAGAQAHPPLFGAREVRNTNIAPFTKWTSMLARQRAEPAHYDDACQPRRGHCYVQEWRALIRQLRGQDRMRQIRAVNAFMNRMHYVEDISNYGVIDHWATPLELLARDGDCEDYAIAKYVTLRELGFPRSDMRILVLNDLNRRLAHAILIVYLDGRAYALDNQIAQVVPADAIHHYRPIFSINEEAWWLHQGPAPPRVAGPPSSPNVVAAAAPRQPPHEHRHPAQAQPAAAAQFRQPRASARLPPAGEASQPASGQHDP
jgi:predicted transglutaminase-like cysteine proteinase